MSWSLQLRSGDLTLGGTSLGTVTGSQKLVQDLRCAILEKMGTDDLHPWYGSLLDGGRDAEGVVSPGYIGETDWELVGLSVQSEIRRIAKQYQDTQAARLENDRLTYGISTLDPSEILLAIGSIQIAQAQDKMLVSVKLQTGLNEDITLNIPLTT